MASGLDKVLSYLREKEFTEEELRDLLKQVSRGDMEYASNKTLGWIIDHLREFKNKREASWRLEFRNVILPEINEVRRERKLERAQETYKQTRKAKKLKNKKK